MLYVVTPDNLTKYIATIKSEEEFKEIVPGRDGGEITIDGSLVETTRPEDEDEQKRQWQGQNVCNKHGHDDKQKLHHWNK